MAKTKTKTRATPSALPAGQKGSSSRIQDKSGVKEDVENLGKASVAAMDDPVHLPEASAWPWASLADSIPSKVAPLLTLDGRYFFSVVGSAIKVHSATTGEIVSTLSSPSLSQQKDGHAAEVGHSKPITALILNPSNAFQLISSSLDGTVRVWDYMDGSLLQTIDLAQAIFYMCAHASFDGFVFVAAGRPFKRATESTSTNEEDAALLRVSLKPTQSTIQSFRQKSSEVVPIGKVKLAAGLGISASGSWLVAIGGHRAYVANTGNLKAGLSKFVSPEKLVSLVFHPSEEHFTTGDAKGVIRTWHCLKDDLMVAVGAEKKAQTTTLHWHAHALTSLAYTPNGAYLLSAGEEAVLVFWQLHSGKKEFVPRVGAPITGVVVARPQDREEEYLLALADGSHLFVSSASLKISRAFSRLKFDPTTCDTLDAANVPAPLAFHAPSASLLLPSSHPSSLQAYTPSTSKLLLELEVSPSNRVSRREDTPIEPTRVVFTTTSAAGDWMATVDLRQDDGDMQIDTSLKLWLWDGPTISWTLNTRIDRPHGNSAVTCAAFQPPRSGAPPTMMTTGEDGAIKVWRLRRAKPGRKADDDYWISLTTTSFRSEIPTHATWSPDGSLLAVTAGPYVVLYDPVTTAVLQVLTSAECPRPQWAHFIGRNGRYVVVSGQRNAVVWDLLSQSIKWHRQFELPVKAVVPHVQDESFAVLMDASNGTSMVEIHRVVSGSPHQSHTLPFGLRNVIWYPSHNQADGFSLVGITQSWAVVVCGDGLSTRVEEGATAQDIGTIGVQSSRTVFQDIFGPTAFVDLEARAQSSTSTLDSADHALVTSSNIASLFDKQAYLMPPIESMFDSILDSFLQTRISEPLVVLEDEAGEQDEDIEMDVVDETPILSDPRQHRVVGEDEMNQFIDIFRRHAVGVSHPTPQTLPDPQPTSTPKPKVKAVQSTPVPKHGKALVTPASTPLTEIALEGTPTTVGKKRKKATT